VAERLYRSRTDRNLAGVAGGLGTWLGVDPTLVRVAWVLLTLLTSGVFLLIYIVMAIVVPEAPDGWAPRGLTGGGGAPGGAPGGAWSGIPGTGWNAPPASWPPDWERQHDAPQPAFPAEGAGLAVGLFLVVLGGWFLVDEYLHLDWALVWPVAVIVAGAALIVATARRSR
jgi:phage shock protein PspC (stress-responsive transcriptional regulator)